MDLPYRREAHVQTDYLANVCPELLEGSRRPHRVFFDRYDTLHPTGRQLVHSWLLRAQNSNRDYGGEVFEAFIFAWISMNAWASCVTGLDRDREWLSALMHCRRLHEIFLETLDRSDRARDNALSFAALWPIFKVQQIRNAGLSYRGGPRKELVERYLKRGVRHDPWCWRRHSKSGEPIPLDWSHTIGVLYRVRCNLFHGEKAPHSEMDRLIVSTAFHTLIEVLQRIL
jgi:hypothetical protein